MQKSRQSIKYQLTIAYLPLYRNIDDFSFDGTPVNESQLRDLATGDFLTSQRNVVVIGGTRIGKDQLAIAIAQAAFAKEPALQKLRLILKHETPRRAPSGDVAALSIRLFAQYFK